MKQVIVLRVPTPGRILIEPLSPTYDQCLIFQLKMDTIQEQLVITY